MNTLSLGAKSFEMPINEKWTVTYFKEDISRAELRFETGEYPVLGVKIVSLDDPKLDISDKLKSHLFDPVLLETNPNLEIKNINNNIELNEFSNMGNIMNKGELDNLTPFNHQNIIETR